MNLFVTVGHTRFDSLFKKIDTYQRDEWRFVFQMYDGEYIPESGTSIRYTDNIDEYYNNADVVITHAGAGTVYHLLEIGKPIIVVANSDRIDTHQEDLIRYVEENHFAQACRNLDDLEGLLNNVNDYEAVKYHSEPFSVATDIAKVLKLID
jgi:beta-1,4-N-acetylglucosaminyltransferase